MNFILREVCKKYKEQEDPTFTPKEVKKRLQGLGSEYLDLNITDLFRRSGLIDVNDSYNLTLNDKGKRSCEVEELSD
jgi:hypothetical protein